MKNYFLLFSPILLLTAWRQTYILYALLKAAGGNDAILGKAPPLTEPGKERAEALKKVLKTKKIGYIFSINTVRTRSTAEPLRAYFNLVTQSYPPVPDSAFIKGLNH